MLDTRSKYLYLKAQNPYTQSCLEKTEISEDKINSQSEN